MFGVLVFGHDKTRMLAYEAMDTSHAQRPVSAESPGEKFEKLVAIMRALRAPGGCPWDREQTRASLRPFVLEETYEVLEAIDAGNMEELREELGDYLYDALLLSPVTDDDLRVDREARLENLALVARFVDFLRHHFQIVRLA